MIALVPVSEVILKNVGKTGQYRTKTTHNNMQTTQTVCILLKL